MQPSLILAEFESLSLDFFALMLDKCDLVICVYLTCIPTIWIFEVPRYF